MRTQKCSRCGAMLDVSQMEKGSKFACSTCGAVLTAGEASVARKSLKDSGPAYQPRAAKEKAQPATPRRVRRAVEAGEGGGEPPTRSRLPLVLGAAAVVVIGVVVAVALSGGGGTPTPQTAAAGASAAVPAPSEPDLGPEAWWARAARNSDGSPRTFDAATLERLLAEAEQRGYPSNAAAWKPIAEKLYGDLVKIRPTHRKANEFFGRKSLRDYPDFAQVFERMQESDKDLPAELRSFLASLEERVEKSDPLWMEPQEYEQHREKLDAFVAWRKKMDEDPAFREVQRAVARAQNDPVLRNYGAVPIGVPPFVVFLGSRALYPRPVEGETPEETRKRIAEKTQELAPRIEKTRRLYEAYVRFFEERYRKPLGLPEPKSNEIIFQWIFEDRAGFDQYARDQDNHEVGAGVLGYFSPQTRWVVLYEREDAEEGGLSNDNTAAHESTHQIQWLFSKNPKNRLENFIDSWAASWFTEGWAEYVGSCRENPETKAIDFGWYSIGRADLLRFMKKQGVPLIPIHFLVATGNYEDFNRWVSSFWLGEARERCANESAERFVNPGTYFGALYAQGWFLCYFLNEFENGKYRDRFNDLVLTALRGRHKPPKYRKNPADESERWATPFDAYCEIFGLDPMADPARDPKWTAMQREHDAFLDKMLQVIPPPKKPLGAPPEPKKEEGGEDAG